MDGYTRYAVYVAPPPGPLARLGAAWLGWDALTARGAPLPDGQDWPALPRPHLELTAMPRRYGLHGTLKPPFRLAEGHGVAALHGALAALAPRLPRLRIDGLRVGEIGPFLALLPEGDTGALDDLAATLVTTLDGFRAPPEATEFARRRAAGLSPRQEEHLRRWGYPHVLDDFRFHMTLTGPIPDPAEREAVATAIAPLFEPLVERPFRIDDICLFGEGQDGRFRLLTRYPLIG